MATWKKVIVSGSGANLATLQVDNLTSGQVVIGGGTGNLSTTAINGSGNIVGTTAATGLSHSGSFSGSFEGNGSGITGITSTTNANLTGAVTSVGNATSLGSFTSLQLLNALTDETGTGANVFATSPTLVTPTLGVASATSLTTTGDISVGGDLIVLGTTVTLNTANLLVEDQFILVASGSSNNTTDGGIVVDRGAYAAGNIAFGYDSATFRWGFQNGLADTANTLDTTASNGVSGSFISHVFTEGSHGPTKPLTGEFALAGAIYTSTAGDIFMYS